MSLINFKRMLEKERERLYNYNNKKYFHRLIININFDSALIVTLQNTRV